MTVARRPAVDAAAAQALARQCFGVDAEAFELPSERDRNFRLRGADGGQAVLKIASAAESRALLEAQNAALQRLAAEGLEDAVPRVLPARDGALLIEHEVEGQRHLVRLLSHVPGTPLARFAPHDPELLRGLGALLGRVGRALGGFEHAALDRPDFAWHPEQAAAVLARGPERFAQAERRRGIERLAGLRERQVAPRLGQLPCSAIHNDANDHNVLVDVAGPGLPPRLGLIDFGDMVWAATVAELAVALAYAMLGKRDPLGAAAAVVAGYHGARPLGEDELAALWGMALARLGTSAVLAVEQLAQAPDNDYLRISQAAVWQLLERLANVHEDLAHGRLRAACGLEPSAAGARVGAWLRAHGASCAAVLGAPLAAAPRAVLDLSVGSCELGSGAVVEDVAGFSAWIEAACARAGAPVGIGRYDEARLLYRSEGFAAESDGVPERRTVHLGVDLFVPAGTPVCAPLDGTVLTVAEHAHPLDYGPTVILSHEPEPGLRFCTLYGHLDPEVVRDLAPGTRVAAGEAFAHVGAPPRNGGWPPHVHLQVLAELLGAVEAGRGYGDFPGVAAPSERAVWLSLCPDPSPLLGLAARAPRADRGDLLRRRRARLGPSLSLSYRAPLHLVRGKGAELFDTDGRAYLDCVNNVCHVGHSHPRVVAALQRQAAVLNTNTRYLHDHAVRYAERLTATLPAPLEVCFFVCSGSEANELALRLARAHAGGGGRRDVLVLDGAYHGNTQGLVDVSPYKHAGPGGEGAPDWVHAVACPDAYRGVHRGALAEVGSAYAEEVRLVTAQLCDRGRAPAAFLHESILSCAGQIVLPDGYLEQAYAHVRQAGGVCIADEVQVGFGRVGSHRWAFEAQGVVPDIVTMGKPIGNGHPLAAVVTTPEIAASFDRGMEYFNTFGGNPVSCAVGLAVLDVLEDEGLQAHAAAVGGQLLAGLRDLQQRHALVGDVRGLGLFLGVELVLDRDVRTPAPAHAAHLAERLRAQGILVSTDGPDHNVIKLKPPLVFRAAQADRLVAALDAVLAEDAMRVGG